MANGKIIQLKELDDLSTPIYPVTKADAVYLQNGSLLTDYLRGFPQTTIGSVSQPIYLNNGVLTAGNEVYSKQETYSKVEIDTLLANKMNNGYIYAITKDTGSGSTIKITVPGHANVIYDRIQIWAYGNMNGNPYYGIIRTISDENGNSPSASFTGNYSPSCTYANSGSDRIITISNLPAWGNMEFISRTKIY